MQLIWVSGPVGRIRRINLTLRNLLTIAAMSVLACVLLGVCLEFAGFRFAIEYDPQLAHRIGNLYSQEEFNNLKNRYESRMSQVEQDLATFQDRLTVLDNLNKKLKFMATPPPLITKKGVSNAQGGPMLNLAPRSNPDLIDYLGDVYENENLLLKYTDTSIDYWKNEVQWLEAKPILFPLQGSIAISSPYGKRVDPIAGRLGFHPGLDFQEAIGTSVFSTAKGIVKSSGWDPEYGNNIIINHGDGYETRYAHLSRLLVKTGEAVGQHQLIGLSGNTGRSTGPHLHYEIIKDGHFINPETMLIQLAHK